MSEDKKERKNKISRESIREAVKLLKYLKLYKYTFALGFFFLILSSLSSLAIFKYMGTVIDVRAENFQDKISEIILLFTGVLVVQAVSSYFRIYLFAIVTENTVANLRKDIYSKLITLPMVYFSDKRVGELISRISSDIDSVKETLTTTLAEFIRQIIIIAGSIILLGVTSWQLVLFILSVIPIMVLFAVLFGRFVRKLSKEAREITAESNTILEETLQAIATVKAFTGELFEIGRYNKKNDDIIKLGIRNSKFRGLFASFIVVFLFGAVTSVIWYGAGLVADNVITNGQLFSFFLLSVFMAASIGGLAETWSSVQKALGSVEHVMKILDETEEPTDSFQEIKLEGAVQFKNVSFSYPSGKESMILKDISFEVAPGGKIALVGPSGAGKSTLTALLMRFYQSDSGSVIVDEKDINDYDLKAFRKNIAIVPQDVILFGGSISENIAYGKPGASQTEIEEAAAKANATEFIDRLPEKYNTLVGERGTKLSGGQRQRIAIARAILKNPVILILDEATSSLDSESERLVQEALEKLMQDRTTLIIAHRLSTVKKADKILVIDQGKIIESGSHEELLKIDNGLYRYLSGLQFD